MEGRILYTAMDVRLLAPSSKGIHDDVIIYSVKYLMVLFMSRL
jgi:hypothetical protein